MEVRVHIDRELGIETTVRLPQGATIGALKQRIARDDPTGETDPAGFELRLPSGGALADQEPVPDAPQGLDLCQAADAEVTKPESAAVVAEEEWEVVHERVVRREEPSKDAKALAFEKQGALVRGTVLEVGGVPWLKTQLGYMMIDGASVGLGALLSKVVVAAEGDYYVAHGTLFKKPGADPATGKVVKLAKEVGCVVKTTGKTWQGPAGGDWVQLDTSDGSKPGWLLVEGPGFEVKGPMLTPAVVGEAPPLVLKLHSMITDSVLCEVCVRPGDSIGALKRWIALRDPHNLKAGKVLIAREKPSSDGQAFSIAFFPTSNLHVDATKIEATSFPATGLVPYFYMGEASDDGAFAK